MIEVTGVSHRYPVARRGRRRRSRGGTQSHASAAHASAAHASAAQPGGDRRELERSEGRLALDGVDLRVEAGQLYVLLGPNGGGKTTLFRLLSTLLLPQRGEVRIGGLLTTEDLSGVRRQLGVVFQAPSVDEQLTVAENIRFQAALYGLWGGALLRRQSEVLDQLGLTERRDERVATLSGGLRRRVELAKTLVHGPRVLLMDEPSTGLDPAARSDLWTYLGRLREATGMTIAMTTHLLDEADRADCLGLLDRGRLIAGGPPEELRGELGGEVLTIQASRPDRLASAIGARWGYATRVVDGSVRVEGVDRGALPELLAVLPELHPEGVESLTLARPTLEDVFVQKTGHRFWSEELR